VKVERAARTEPAEPTEQLAESLEAERFATDGPMTAVGMQRMSQLVGNEGVVKLLGKRSPQSSYLGQPGRALQRTLIKYPDAGETIYEDPSGGGTAAQNQFVATPYSSTTIKYDMERKPTEAVVTVKIQFLDQKRGENKWMKDKYGQFVTKAGQKVPDPTFTQDIGTPKEIPAGDPRRDFAISKCKGITAAWDHYSLISKQKAKAAPSGGSSGGTPDAGAAPTYIDVDLPMRFVADPDFALNSPNADAQVRLYGMGVIADRSGANPIDSGHWYMDTKTNYGDMDLTAVSAHEYGHLMGLQDEYYISDDQTHQMLHRMGGGAKNSDKSLDEHTVRLMITAALYPVISRRMAANIKVVSKAFNQAHKTLRKQLAGAVKAAWADGSVRSAIVDGMLPSLSRKELKSSLPGVVAFETGPNFSNLEVASRALASWTGQDVADIVLGMLDDWEAKITSEKFVATDAAGTKTSITTELSSNITGFGSGKGAGAAAASGLADTFAGASGLKVYPSSTLLGQLEAIPEQWKDPGKGLDSAYTPAAVLPSVKAAVDSAVAAGVVSKMKSARDLYVGVLKLVTSTSKASAKKVASDFIGGQVRPTVQSQLGMLNSTILTEVDAVLGMKAGAMLAKSPRDPNLASLASQLSSLLKSQQNPGAYDQAADINPGAGSAGQDVRQTAITLMGGGDAGAGMFRGGMIQPVVDKFNANFKHADEDNFTAKVR
jgi:hypothetical protein